MQLFGKSITAKELRRRVGLVDQVAGIRLATLESGHARGSRVALVQTGSGLEFTVLVDRGLDIGAATYNGAPLAWRGSVGDVAPQYFEAEHLRWLRSFQGGLLATCGLSNVGAPQSGSELSGLGLHGRIGSIPAQDLCITQQWDKEHYVLRISGLLREACVFGEKFALRRTITAWLGESRISVQDDLTNEAFHEAPFQLLYHVNIGWPVVGEGARILAPSRTVAPRDAVAKAGIGQWDQLTAPQHGFQEQVYFHDMKPGKDGRVTAAIVNGDFSKPGCLGVALSYSADTLPRFAEWKMMGEQEYVVGLEPANCGVQGRAVDEAHGLLHRLKPSETVHYRLDFSVIKDAADYQAVKKLTGAGRPKVAGSYLDFVKPPKGSKLIR
ncbi:MAG: hypothetical protein RLZZ303_902 [Candidatus Hydrogenedentota bacterium]|jgi:hypothetical protein